MLRRLQTKWRIARDFTRSERGAALIALAKSGALLAALSEMGWLLDVYYFARRFPQLPISLAWSMLTMIFLIATTQLTGSVAVKLWGVRRARRNTAAAQRMTDLLCAYLADEARGSDVAAAANDSPSDFEAGVADALLRLRGSAVRKLREMPPVQALRDRWIARVRSGGEEERRRTVENLGMLRDPAGIPALEAALEDPAAQGVAAAVRGLLKMPSHGGRAELIRSLPGRAYLIRVLTASEARHLPAPVESRDPARAHCDQLARRGAIGIHRLRSLAAHGKAGDAPAEALSASLVAAARGGH